jgi:hypothetical protein
MRLFLQSIASADPQTEQAEWMVETATKGLRSPTTEEQVGSGHDEQTEGPQSVFAGPTQGTRPAPHVRPGFKPDPRTVAAVVEEVDRWYHGKPPIHKPLLEHLAERFGSSVSGGE